jgi:hypothetical protein
MKTCTKCGHNQDLGRKRQILRDLKSTRVDCGGVFHYSQMDFDHLGGKLAPVSRLTGVEECEIVCANCHRIRTHCAKPERKQSFASSVPIGSWQGSVGFMEDQSVGTLPDRVIAEIGEVTRSAVGHYRRRLGVPDYNSIGARQ